ncbi:WD domain, G-beta repeat domain-containing protein [Theileria equi strain WA]|uniref:WD domain, G-beta repeat domain-containing protein n=1 Tax=Theileria equi strain WA TaxID=1537102 RepID=L0B1D1_THEEQ|nr:WD domain, G-beta repeat domain-containing protein [Theileria equi strain WA]AFZ80909.1 WD domain, G-beta repeat domain-containing protein [Theileria equi strain WA]|eukprot:XP_004830575.1 WD domain, G-beta repeat domain-containing protein [Theileria equi strain WA]
MTIKLQSSVEKRSHKNCITSVAVHSEVIATGGKDSTVELDQLSQTGLKTIKRYNLIENNIVKCNATSVDITQGTVICGTNVGLVNIIDTREDKINEFPAHKDQISYVKYLTDNVLVSAGFDRKVRVWDTRNLEIPIHDLVGHTASVNYIDTLPFIQEEDEYSVSFGDNYERILTSASDRTARLWNVNRGTHLAFQVPIELSQNVESCVVMQKTPHYVFAVGLDSEYLLVYSIKFKLHIGSLSIGKGVCINCIRKFDDLLIVGTSAGKLHFVECSFSKDYSKCEMTIVSTFDFKGSVNDLKITETPDGIVLYSAIGTELRLGRWLNISLDGGIKPKNLLNVSTFQIDT